MHSILITVIPVFALIMIGYLAATTGLMDKQAADGLSRFVFVFAIPALLFRTAMKINLNETLPWQLWGAFFGSAAVVWCLAIFISLKITSLRPAGGAPAAIASSFGNLVMLGIPLSVAHYGVKAAIPAALIVAIHAPVHWFFATLRAEWSAHSQKPVSTIFAELAINLARNPIVMALVLGIAFGLTGIGLDPVIDRTISLLGQAGIPAALFALGLSLAAFGFKGNIRGLTVILVLKMMVFPLVASLMAFKVFALPPLSANVVVLFSCLPPGANAYIFANRYNASVAPVSGAIAIGTFIALFTVTAALWLLGPLPPM